MSVPLSLPWDEVQRFKRRFIIGGYDISLWDRNTYQPHLFKEADSIIFLLPNFDFEYNTADLPIGLKKELKDALEANKKIYIGYATSSGEYNIYNAEANSYQLKGIKGTANKIFDEKSIVIDTSGRMGDSKGYTSGSLYGVRHIDIKVTYNDEFDERLLLLV
jgi:hypothetical protein